MTDNRGSLPPPPRGPAPDDGASPPPTPRPSAPARLQPADAPARLQPADVGARIGAFLIDYTPLFIVRGVTGFVLSFLVGVGSSFAMPQADRWGLLSTGVGTLVDAAFAALIVAYFAWMESKKGQTLGKMAAGVRVVQPDGSPITVRQGIIRRLPFVAGSIVPVIGPLVSLGLYITLTATMASDQPEHRGFHDRWATTQAVKA